MADNISTLSVDGLKGSPSGTGNYYTKYSDWTANEQTDLVTDGDTHSLECFGDNYGGADGGLVDQGNLNGWVCDETNYIAVRAAAGQEHNGVRRADGGQGMLFLWNTGNGMLLQDLGLDAYIHIEGIELQANTLNTSGNYSIRAWDTFEGIMNLKRLILNGRSDIRSDDNSKPTYVENTLFLNIGLPIEGRSREIYFYNCTIIEAGTNTYAIYNGSTTRLQNTIAYGGSTRSFLNDSGSNVPAENKNNAGSSGPVYGADSITDVPTTAFVDYQADGSGDYNPTPSPGAFDSTGNGTDVSSSYTDDIAGNPRSAAPLDWEIGAYEIVAGGGTTTPISKSFSGVGTASLSKSLELSKVLASTALGTAALTKSLELGKILPSTAIGTASLSKSLELSQTLSSIASGTASLSTLFIPADVEQELLSPVAIGTASLLTRLELSEDLSYTALGTASLALVATHFRSFSMDGIGSATVSGATDGIITKNFFATGSVGRQLGVARTLNHSGVGTVGLARSIFRTLNHTAVGTSVLTPDFATSLLLTPTGIGTCSLSTRFIPKPPPSDLLGGSGIPVTISIGIY